MMTPEAYAHLLDSARPLVEKAVSFADEWPEKYREEVFRLVAGSGLAGRAALLGTTDVSPPSEQGRSTAEPGAGALARLAAAVEVPPDDLRRVVDLEEGAKGVRILGRIHGDSDRDTQNRYSVVYAYIKEKAFGEMDVHVDDLRQLCKDHGCYDSANFTSYFRRDTRLNEVRGSDPKRYILTKSGLEEAKRLLREMAEA